MIDISQPFPPIPALSTTTIPLHPQTRLHMAWATFSPLFPRKSVIPYKSTFPLSSSSLDRVLTPSPFSLDRCPLSLLHLFSPYITAVRRLRILISSFSTACNPLPVPLRKSSILSRHIKNSLYTCAPQWLPRPVTRRTTTTMAPPRTTVLRIRGTPLVEPSVAR